MQRCKRSSELLKKILSRYPADSTRLRAGHYVEVRLPEEIPSLHLEKTAAGGTGTPPDAGNLEGLDFLGTPALREAIHAREAGFCFIACAASPRNRAASTTLFHAPKWAPISTAT